MIRTRVGYTGGVKPNPTYHSLGDHTETVEIDFDPTRISFEDLLGAFWKGHNPHSAFFSRQYKAAVYYHNEEQRRLAEESKLEIALQSGRPVTTEILEAGTFYRAEDYHQKYYLRHNSNLMNELDNYYAGKGMAFTDSTLSARFNGYAGGVGTSMQLFDEIDSYGISEIGKSYLREIAPSLSSETAHACGLLN